MIKKPDFFIVGAPKTGTTAMYSYLRQHPQIYMPGKEIHYFGSDLTMKKKRISEKEYLYRFRYVKNEQRIGEASVGYLISKLAASEIKVFNPDASIIIMLRNPVDLIFSLHSQMLLNGYEIVENFEKALQMEESRKMGLNIPASCTGPAEALFYRRNANLYEQVERYLSMFKREKVHIILYDDFRKNTSKSYFETLDFLGVNPAIAHISFPVVNPNGIIKNKKIYKAVGFLRKNKILQTITDKIFPFESHQRAVIRKILIDRISRMYTHEVQREPMKTELRSKLQMEFKPEIIKLSSLIGRDLSKWYSSSNKNDFD